MTRRQECRRSGGGAVCRIKSRGICVREGRHSCRPGCDSAAGVPPLRGRCGFPDRITWHLRSGGATLLSPRLRLGGRSAAAPGVARFAGSSHPASAFGRGDTPVAPAATRRQECRRSHSTEANGLSGPCEAKTSGRTSGQAGSIGPGSDGPRCIGPRRRPTRALTSCTPCPMMTRPHALLLLALAALTAQAADWPRWRGPAQRRLRSGRRGGARDAARRAAGAVAGGRHRQPGLAGGQRRAGLSRG
jgi:hypothetical protein